MQDAILILDHDEALAGLIARTLRSQQIYCEPVPFGIPFARAMALAPRGLIIAAAQGVAVPLDGMDGALLDAGLPVLAGPVEATALGNVLVQARARGLLAGDLETLRALVRATQDIRRFEPRTAAARQRT